MQIAPVGPMGVALAINFQPTGGGKAAVHSHCWMSSRACSSCIFWPNIARARYEFLIAPMAEMGHLNQGMRFTTKS